MLTPESRLDHPDIDFTGTTDRFYICACYTVSVTLTLDRLRKSRNSTQLNTPPRLRSLPCYL